MKDTILYGVILVSGLLLPYYFTFIHYGEIVYGGILYGSSLITVCIALFAVVFLMSNK